MHSRFRAVVKRADILSAFGVSSAVLSVAACISGQDHVKGIKGYGFVKALNLLRTWNTAGQSAETILNKLPDAFPNQRLEAVVCQCEGIRLLRWYRGSGTTRMPMHPELSSRPSFIEKFLWEKDDDDDYRRHGLALKISKAIQDEAMGIARPRRFAESMTHEKFLDSARAERKRLVDAKDFITEVMPAIPLGRFATRNRFALLFEGKIN
jgi:hypothetical protein